jgi:TPR repeat protein
MRCVAYAALGALALALLGAQPAAADGKGEGPKAAADIRTKKVVRVARTVRLTRARVCRGARVGFAYETGQGVPQDYASAAYWYSRGAECGDPNAQHLLGLMYDRGFGVPLDHMEAHKWLNLAAARASRPNREYYARIRNAVASKMTFPEVIEAQRRAREWWHVRAW